MSDIVEFLLARVAEDGAGMELAASRRPFDGRARWLAECEAKRRIIAMAPPAYLDDPHWNGYDHAHADVLELLALPYADHPDYDETWRP